MGKLVVNMFMTLDGVIQSPGRIDEDPEAGFSYGGWQVPYDDEEAGQLIAADYAKLDALLLGRKTYEIWAPYWQQAPSSNPFTKLLNEKPKYVASRTLTNVDWNNTKLLDEDVATSVSMLKERYAEVHVAGSSGLLQTLLHHELIDREHMAVSGIARKGKAVLRFRNDTGSPAIARIQNIPERHGSIALRGGGKTRFPQHGVEPTDHQ